MGNGNQANTDNIESNGFEANRYKKTENYVSRTPTSLWPFFRAFLLAVIVPMFSGVLGLGILIQTTNFNSTDIINAKADFAKKFAEIEASNQIKFDYFIALIHKNTELTTKNTELIYKHDVEKTRILAFLESTTLQQIDSDKNFMKEMKESNQNTREMKEQLYERINKIEKDIIIINNSTSVSTSSVITNVFDVFANYFNNGDNNDNDIIVNHENNDINNHSYLQHAMFTFAY